MKKKIVSVMLTAAMAATLLAGCGSSSAATDTAAEETLRQLMRPQRTQKQLMRLQKIPRQQQKMQQK